MILTIDVGNSNICIGAHGGGGVRLVGRLATDHRKEADQYAVEMGGVLGLYRIEPGAVEGIAIASVVPALTPVLVRALRHFTAVEPMILTRHSVPGIKIDIEDPDELGTDIIASAIAVAKGRPLPAVIVDMGTATKLIAVDRQGVIRGCSIAPGLLLSLHALVKGASQLGGISLEAPEKAIGRNTLESMRSGVVLGTAAMLDGMIERFSRELGGVETVIATGGVAAVVAPHCAREIEVDETLLLEGLYLAWKQARQG